MKRLIIACAAVAGVGCAAQLTPEMEAVRSTDGKGCQFVTSDTFEVQPFNVGRYLKSRTHNLGGDAYKVVSTNDTGIGVMVHSEVYRCD